MDEISNGLDSSTTFQIMSSLRQAIHILGGTAVISLLQPAPETYNLFDDVMLLSDGQIVYHGHREDVLDFLSPWGSDALTGKVLLTSCKKYERLHHAIGTYICL